MTNDFSNWIGRYESVADEMGAAIARAAAATFDDNVQAFQTGVELPPLWHWFYFLSPAQQNRLGDDGHPQRAADSFMPPIPLPRRMFAGARLAWHRPLLLGRTAERTSQILDVQLKSGRSGQLAFVTVASQVMQNGAVCLEEQQDIVFREPGKPVPPPKIAEFPLLAGNAWSRVVAADPRMLFRFSALTFNAHRIHYDRPYAMGEEGYPGLVVHGPLSAILLLRLAQQHTSQNVTGFEFRSKAPLFDVAAFRLVGTKVGNRIELSAQAPDGVIAMEAVAEVAES